jgi:hypothetical protein
MKRNALPVPEGGLLVLDGGAALERGVVKTTFEEGFVAVEAKEGAAVPAPVNV